MQLKRLIFIASVIILSITCISIMNINQDRLSRYPYKNEKDREIIKEFLNDEEIEYIIEWSIAPDAFIDFISYENFNIYHSNEYSLIQDNYPYFIPKDIVNMVEETFDILTIDELIAYLYSYEYSAISNYLKDKEDRDDLFLVKNANTISAHVNHEYYLSTRVPHDLVLIDQLNTLDDESMYISKRAYSNLTSMCEVISTELNVNNCANLIVKNGYISYEQQKHLYNEGKLNYKSEVDQYVFQAGHSEAQLGFSLDFVITGIEDDEFNMTKQYEWLSNNAHKYGFYQSYNESNHHLTNMYSQDNHFRYVGTDIATSLYESEHKGEIVNE